MRLWLFVGDRLSSGDPENFTFLYKSICKFRLLVIAEIRLRLIEDREKDR